LGWGVAVSRVWRLELGSNGGFLSGQSNGPVGRRVERTRQVTRQNVSEAIRTQAVKPLDVTTQGVGDSETSLLSESRLVEESRRGRTTAYGELVRLYERRLVRVIGRFIADAWQVEDLAQETFLRAYTRLGQFDTSRRFGPWLFRIGVNLTLDHLRKVKRRGRMALFSESPYERSPDPSIEDPRRDLDLKQEVREVLESVPEKYRTVLVLRDLENFSTAEISGILDRKEATIRWRLAEARQRFQKLWQKRLEQSPTAAPTAAPSQEDLR
jgi:RNA polymerase sigma-70 factor (ECF subfamily)